MRTTFKHEASRASTWGLGLVAVLGGLYEYLPAVKTIVPPPAFAVIAGVALVAKVFQKKISRAK